MRLGNILDPIVWDLSEAKKLLVFNIIFWDIIDTYIYIYIYIYILDTYLRKNIKSI